MMKVLKKILVIFLLIAGMSGLRVKPCQATTLLTEKEALKSFSRECDEIITEKKAISEAQKKKLEKGLGGKLVEHPGAKGAGRIINQKDFQFYFCVKDGKRTGAAVILEEPGRWGPIKFIIKLNLEGKVEDVAVMSYSETRGRPIARKSFLKQFIGKTSRDAFLLNRDIVCISGATVSSGATAFTVKKAILLYEELFLKK